MSNGPGILVLIVPIDIEDGLVDFLLEHDSEQGFSSQRISGHSSSHEGLTTLEQVTGRQRRVRFEIQMAREDADEILERLQESFEGVGIHYWFVPVLSSGHID